jgi:dihydrolipoamide dehydrogenase
VLVLGGGPGGYAAAFAAADLGLQVTLVDDAPNPGGVCLYRGCIPSKTLLHVARLLREAEEARAFGVAFAPPAIDLAALRRHKEQVVAKLTGGLGQLARQRKITYLQGRGRFISPHSLTVQRADSAVEVTFDYAIIATGSLPRTLDVLKGQGDLVWDSTAALELSEVPRRLLVVGGGYIGVELASVYQALGAEVTLLEVTAGLLPGVDPDLVRPLLQSLKGRMRLHFETSVAALERSGDGLRATIEGKDGRTLLEVDRLLASVGRAPQTAGIGLEALGLSPGGGGFLEVDAQRRTTLEHLFAIGDVAGQPMLAHKASHEGRVAAEAIAGRKAAFDARAITAVVFTDPEIAWAGLSEQAAKAAGIEPQVGKFPWAASGRAASLGRGDGLTKIVADRATGRVLGVGIVGPGAGELIAEGALAIEMGALAEDVAHTIHPHPTLSETMMEAAEGILGHATHYYGR